MADNTQFVRDAFDTFNKADIDGLTKIIADDAVQHMHGSNQAHPRWKTHTGGRPGNGQDDGPTGQRRGKTLDSKNTIAFTLRDGKIVDIDDTPSDVAAWDDFWG